LNRLAQLCSARGVAGIGGQVTRDHERSCSYGRRGRSIGERSHRRTGHRARC
jgi:hypothetical protein